MDVYPLRLTAEGLLALVLRRAPEGRVPGSWEAVHGHIDPGESPVVAARRELREETGYRTGRWYNLSRIEAFYRHRGRRTEVIAAFAVMVDDAGDPLTSDEHDAWEWLPIAAACGRVSWPRIRRALEDAQALLGAGDAGPLDDVLWIPED